MKHSCINKLYTQLYFCTSASCICLSSVCLVLLCISEVTRWLRTYTPPGITVIIYCGLCFLSALCSNIFSHAAIGQYMRHKIKKTGNGKTKRKSLLWKGFIALLYARKIYKEGINWCVVVPDELRESLLLFWINDFFAACWSTVLKRDILLVANHSRGRRTSRNIHCAVSSTIAACYLLSRLN